MKIQAVDVFVLKTPLAEPFAFSQGWVSQRAATLVRVTTDDGLEGWGEAFAQGLEPPEISAAVIEHALRPIVMGANPLDTSVLWHNIYNLTRDYGRKGSVIAGISALDIACWDIAGKFYRQPIYQLLGGAVRTSVIPYATGFYRLNGQNEADRLAEEAREHQAAGFSAMKIKLGFGVDDDINVMRTIYKALMESDGGSDIELMVDTNHAYGYSEALRLGRELENYRLRWYEEPVVPENIDGMAKLRSALSIPIAAGENEHTPYGFHSLIHAGAIDVAQPDIGSCGGITAARDIAVMAQAAGLMVNPHVWGSAVSQAASLQWIATLPVPHHSLYPTQPILEYDRSSHPFRQQLITDPWKLDNGVIAIPDKPGLGITVDMDTVEQFKTH